MDKPRIERLFVREALSWLAYLTFLPVSVFGVPLTIANQDSRPGAFLEWMGVGFIAFLVGAIAIVVAHTIPALRDRDNQSGLPVLAGIASAGALRGLCIALASAPLNLNDNVLPIIRVANSSVTATIWLAITGLVIAARQRYVNDYQRLFQNLVTNTLVEGSVRDAGDSLSALEATAQELVHLSSGLRRHISNATQATENTFADVRAIAERIHRTIEDDIRPLSHRLWFKEPFAAPRLRLRQLVLDAATKFPLPTRAVLSVVIPGLCVGFPVRFGVSAGLPIAIVASTIEAAVVVLANLVASHRRSIVVSIGTGLLLASAPALTLLAMWPSEAGVDKNPVAALVSFFTIPAFVVMLQMVSLARADRLLVLSDLERLLQESSIESLHSEITQAQIASYLHNTVQSELTSVALQLEDAADRADVTAARQSLVRAEQILNRSFVDDFNAFYASPIERIAALPLAWQGIASVDIDLAACERLPRATQLVVSQIVEEGIANAVRSGGATRISIDLETRGDVVELFVNDNGVLPDPMLSGLGTSWLNSIAGERWQRTHDENGTTLHATLGLISDVI